MQHPLPTTRLEFRRWQHAHFELALSLWGDPRVMQFLGGPYTRDEVIARLDREIANDAEHGIQYWPLFTRDGVTFAGCCGLKPLAPELGHYEIGFHLLPPFWGSGYASEAARAVMAFAFDHLRANALFAGHHPENDKSANVLARLGFACIGTHFFARTGLDHPWYRRSAITPPADRS